MKPLMVYLAPAGDKTVYREDVYDLCRRGGGCAQEDNNSDKEGESDHSGEKTQKQNQNQEFDDPLLRPSTAAVKEDARTSAKCAWRCSVLILIPMKLGAGSQLNTEAYARSLEKVFRFPQSVGFIGGRPRHALYFVGTQPNNSKSATASCSSNLMYLDPHTVQPSVTDDEFPKFPTIEALRTYHCSVPKTTSPKSIDSSLALGFYCKDAEDFEDFCQRAALLANETRDGEAGKDKGGASEFMDHLFVIAQKRQSMKSMDDALLCMDLDDTFSSGGDDDDFVLL